MGKSVLTILLGFIVIFSTVSNNINQASLETELNLYDSYDKLTAKNIAEGGANYILNKLKNNTLWRGTKSNMQLAVLWRVLLSISKSAFFILGALSVIQRTRLRQIAHDI